MLNAQERWGQRLKCKFLDQSLTKLFCAFGVPEREEQEDTFPGTLSKAPG
jgi:hypothetical protein